jgi:hypothetical protein
MLTIKIDDNKNLNINVEKYAQPVTKYGQSTPFIMNQVLYNGMHGIAEDLGTTIDADDESGVDPITLLTDLIFYGPEQCIERLFKNSTVKKWIRNENAKHTSDLACVLQWSGQILGGTWCNHLWSAFNSLKAYVTKNWSESAKTEFWMSID